MSVLFHPNGSELDHPKPGTVKEFNTVREMARYVCSYWNSIYKQQTNLPEANSFEFVPLEVSDVVFTLNCDEQRYCIGWRDCMRVCFTRNPWRGRHRFPQCVGVCALDYDKPVRSEE